MTTLALTRGDSETLLITATEADGTPQDLTGMDLWFTAKSRLADLDADAVIQKTVGAGIVITDATGGLAEVTIDPVDTEDLDAVTLYWDVQAVDGSGTVRTLDHGRLAIRADVTRDIA